MQDQLLDVCKNNSPAASSCTCLFDELSAQFDFYEVDYLYLFVCFHFIQMKFENQGDNFLYFFISMKHSSHTFKFGYVMIQVK